ncbi:MAG: phosphoethanolamine--lipid A transferase [Magnetococcales bacterium]|nr:phosphoethanolamine--lipid A transferase [Magnetococcales bacterium]
MNSSPLTKSTKSMSAHKMSMIVAAMILALFNQSLWQEVVSLSVDDTLLSWLFPISLFFIFFLALNIIITLFAWPGLFKPVVVTLIIISVMASYFIDTYGVMINRDMVRNLFQTDVREASDLISLGMITHLIIWGAVPAFLIIKQPISYQPWFKNSIHKSVIVAICSALIVTMIYSGFKQYSIFLRNHRHLRHLLTPANIIYNSTSLLKKIYFNTPKELQRVGLDAQAGDLLQNLGKKSLFVLVVGETARADHFSLQGYERETNPELKKADGIYFSNVSSCGTATATSLPCMFSANGRRSFSNEKARHTEGLLDIMQRAGVRVVWLDNNSGCKGACDRVEHEDISQKDGDELCKNGTCFDEILNVRLEEILKTANGPLLVVLHQLGSHGPAYFKRYPDSFKRFTPTCDKAQIENCPQQNIINTYDNTLLYTDAVLADLIKLLKQNSKKYDSAMLYISDHGESLGENGIYLHGLPYSIAPSAQTHVPMYVWLSKAFANNMKLNTNCTISKKSLPFSHDNLFHTMLGIMDVKTSSYKKNLDIFEDCRK